MNNLKKVMINYTHNREQWDNMEAHFVTRGIRLFTAQSFLQVESILQKYPLFALVLDSDLVDSSQVRALKQISPDVPIILEVPQNYIVTERLDSLKEVYSFLVKPYSISDILLMCHHLTHYRLALSKTHQLQLQLKALLPKQAENLPDPQPESKPHLLMIDDDPSIYTIADALELQGYSVTTRSDGAAGLKAAANESFDLIISDINMPRKDGMAFHQELLECRPEMAERLVFITGGQSIPEVRQFLNEIHQFYLTKPFSIKELIKMIKRVLDKREKQNETVLNTHCG